MSIFSNWNQNKSTRLLRKELKDAVICNSFSRSSIHQYLAEGASLLGTYKGIGKSDQQKYASLAFEYGFLGRDPNTWSLFFKSIPPSKKSEILNECLWLTQNRSQFDCVLNHDFEVKLPIDSNIFSNMADFIKREEYYPVIEDFMVSGQMYTPDVQKKLAYITLCEGIHGGYLEALVAGGADPNLLIETPKINKSTLHWLQAGVAHIQSRLESYELVDPADTLSFKKKVNNWASHFKTLIALGADPTKTTKDYPKTPLQMLKEMNSKIISLSSNSNHILQDIIQDFEDAEMSMRLRSKSSTLKKTSSSRHL